MELATQRVLDKALCATQPTWTYRTQDGLAILRFSARIEDDAYGQLCVKVNGQPTVKSFYYYPKALPSTVPVGVVLNAFLESLKTEAKLDVEYLSWSEDAKCIKVGRDLHFTTVGSEVICKRVIGERGAILDCIVNENYKSLSGYLTDIAEMEYGHYCGPLPFKPIDACNIKVVKLKGSGDRDGVYLTEALGQSIAQRELLDESLGSDATIIEFPLETKIITVDFLKGLLLEVYCQSGSTAHFLNRYRLVGAKDLKHLLTEFVNTAVSIKRNRKRNV